MVKLPDELKNIFSFMQDEVLVLSDMKVILIPDYPLSFFETEDDEELKEKEEQK